MTPDNRSGLVRIEWGGAMRRLRLAIGELEELQEATGVGAFTLTQRLVGHDWRVADVRETIRLGLIGGGMSEEGADQLVAGITTMDVRLGVPVAIVVLAAALTGSPEEQQFKRASRAGNSEPELPEGRLRFGSFYRAAGAIGVSVADMRTMTLWQFNEVVDGFVESKSDGKDAGLSPIEEDQLGALLAAPV